MVYKVRGNEKIALLFEGWQETMIWSCIQNVMGSLYADSPENPASAMGASGDFCFFAGKPNEELVRHWFHLYQGEPEICISGEMMPGEGMSGDTKQITTEIMQKTSDTEHPWGVIMVPKNEEWGDLIETCYGKRAKKVTRYAIKKEPGVFDKEELQAAIDALPDGYILKMVDENLFWTCREIPWCMNWVSHYEDYEMYRKYGLGAVVLKDGEPVSGASSYISFQGGIEIEIDTREDHRRKGLAYACAAKLILECLERDWYPSWDAQNKWSVALAEKLGYHFDHEYTAYEVVWA